MTKFIAFLILGLTASISFADDHSTITDRPVEIWTCSFNEGKTSEDLEAWYADMDKFGDTMTNGQWASYMWVPTFVSDLTKADVALTFSFSSLTDMGKTMDEFFGSKKGMALFGTFQEILDCSGREIFTVTQMREAS